MEQVFKALKFIFGEALSSAFKDETHIKVRDCNDTVYKTLLELKQIKETKSSEALKKLMTFVDVDESYYSDYDDYMADVNAVKLAVNTLKLTSLQAQKNKRVLDVIKEKCLYTDNLNCVAVCINYNVYKETMSKRHDTKRVKIDWSDKDLLDCLNLLKEEEFNLLKTWQRGLVVEE